ncbi:MAG: hypothetical protein GF421_11565 [Candidatus Aminicenantes bacterium]|nr:hypothetical protein [Candidatus Aminicenantes bacterium]
MEKIEIKTRRIINVQTGEVKTGDKNTILKSNAIASCVVVSAYDSIKEYGALAHIMVPGEASEKKVSHQTRYAKNAINEMIEQMTHMGAEKGRIETCLVGGGNVLKRDDDTIGHENLASVVKLLNEKQIKIRKKAVGGTKRRTILFDIEKGTIHYTEGNSKKMLLWKAAHGFDKKKGGGHNEG